MLTAVPLPPPSAEEAAQATRVADAIRRDLEAAGGWIPFSRFMDTALYAPGLGYYASDRPLFGVAGDFVTAPELSPVFAACVANGLADLLDRAGGGDVVEFGAGSGRFARDVLAALLERGAAPRRYRIVEPSAALAARQQALLAATPALAARCEWLAAPPAQSWQGVAFANEVLDALPVDRFRVAAAGVEAIGVAAEGGGFRFAARAADAALAGAVAALQRALPASLPPGFESEIRLGQRDWLAAATAAMRRGAVLLIDYGLPRAQYYHAARWGGTLCAFRRQRRIEDVLADPGLQDLTAWVDFSALAEDAAACGLAVGGFSTQAHYLIATGIERELARRTDSAALPAAAAERQAAALLMLPGEMGERFKAMALLRGIRGPVHGFGFRDLSPSL